MDADNPLACSYRNQTLTGGWRAARRPAARGVPQASTATHHPPHSPSAPAGNWYEGRLQSRDYKGKGPTRERVMPFQLSQQAQAGLYKTTKQVDAERARTCPPLKEPATPSMVTPDAASTVIAAHAGVTGRKATWQLDRPTQACDVPDRFETSYKRSFASAAVPTPDK
jgi:hypothetical protein